MSALDPSYETPVRTYGRAALLGIASFLTGVFLVALLLSPDPRGFGTHQQLGLPPCTFWLLFGYPCPGCGMTTCFSHFVRGHLVEAARANLAGVILATVCALLIPWCLISAMIGRLWLVSDPVSVGGSLMIGLSSLTVLLWVVRLIGFVS